ncbi:TnsA-like heteromeric transposase endonuclease subunit [Streptosporangium sp. H16]|uniref:TnsA-like heteromeric transposase endonuclease subunit n=1 Tax=Streptosporangium sp. H16 TaxID=3444184 RepID=UPI003F78F4CA
MTSGNPTPAGSQSPPATSENTKTGTDDVPAKRRGARPTPLPATYKRHLAEYAVALEEVPLSAGTRRTYASRVRVYLAWLAKRPAAVRSSLWPIPQRCGHDDQVSADSLEAASRFDVAYVDADGVERSVKLEELSRVKLEAARPVRSFPSYAGQRNYPGWYWSATMGRLVGFESWVERDHLIAIDFDPVVTAVASQPFWLRWSVDGRPRRHAPDFFVRVAGGGVLVLDSRPLDRIGESDREAFQATQQACDLLGWRYAVWGHDEWGGGGQPAVVGGLPASAVHG